MQKEKPSIFERLLGTVRLEESEHETQPYNNGKKDLTNYKNLLVLVTFGVAIRKTKAKVLVLWE